MKTSIDGTARAITAAMPALDATDQRIATSIHRLLRGGKPVDPAAVGFSRDVVEVRLNAWPGVFRDRKGNIVGFWGQSITALDPEYRLEAQGKTSYAWCALDTLFIPGVVGETIRVHASDPLTGEPISLLVDPDRVQEVTPVSVVVSMVIPDAPFGYDVVESFCHSVRFFASRESGAKWAEDHEGTVLLGIDETFEIGRALTQRMAG